MKTLAMIFGTLFVILLLALSGKAEAHDDLYGTVRNVVPNYQTVMTVKPDCEYVTEYRHGANIGTFAGGAAGGALGSLIGGGTGKMVAIAGGAVLGSHVGQNMVNNPKTKLVCKDVYVPTQVKTGYQITVQHLGHTFQANVDHNPGVGARIPLGVYLQ